MSLRPEFQVADIGKGCRTVNDRGREEFLKPGDSLLSRAQRKISDINTKFLPMLANEDPNDPAVRACQDALLRWRGNIQAAIGLMNNPQFPYKDNFTAIAQEVAQ